MLGRREAVRRNEDTDNIFLYLNKSIGTNQLPSKQNIRYQRTL